MILSVILIFIQKLILDFYVILIIYFNKLFQILLHRYLIKSSIFNFNLNEIIIYVLAVYVML
jgi:hypothetical protein